MKWALTADAPGKRCLMQGNEAIVRGAVEAGINFASSYPGSPSSQILGMLGEVAGSRGFYAEWATNEVCAFESCIGVSLANARSICIVKQNGLLCAADALHCGAQHGVKGGFVIVTSDDPSAHSSTNEFDSRYQAMSSSVPLLEPTNMQEAKDMVPYAFELSEKLHQMVIVRLTTRVCHGRGNVVLGKLPKKPKQMEKVGEWDRLACVSYLHSEMLRKRDAAQAEAEVCPYNHYEGPAKAEKLIICGGTGRLYSHEALLREGLSKEVGLLSLASIWPLPEKLILKHLRSAKQVLIVEEVDPFLETNIAAIAGRNGLCIKFFGRGDGALPQVGELDPDNVGIAVKKLCGIRPKKAKQQKADLPERELTFCAGCPHRATFYLLKKLLKEEKNPGVVLGDIGCYIMSSQHAGFYAYQACNCMGSGINLAEGLGQLTKYGLDQKCVTVCGDSTFFHTIMPGVVNAQFNHSNMLLLVLDNSATAMTGFQPHPGTGITAMGQQVDPMSIQNIVESMTGNKVVVADPFDMEDAGKKIREALHKDGFQVIIMRQPCATFMGKNGREKKKVYVDQNICLGDDCGCNRFCSRVWACPGNSWDFKNGKAVIDPVSCIGCGVCAKLCPRGAIKVEGGTK